MDHVVKNGPTCTEEVAESMESQAVLQVMGKGTNEDGKDLVKGNCR